jgi:hypothetical protein
LYAAAVDSFLDGLPRAAGLLEGVLRHLVEAVERPHAADPARRRPALTLDGTPVVFSVDLASGEDDPLPRILVEPGALSLTVSQQLELARTVLGELCEALGWPPPEPWLAPIWEQMVPDDRAYVDTWWGGAFLGAAPCSGGVELRLYLNLRNGDAATRWQRLADVLCGHADERFADPFARLVDRVAPHGIPVGLGCVVREGRLCGLRSYAGLHEPSPQAIAGACALGGRQPRDEAALLCSSYTGALGEFRRQGVTVSHDFRVDGAGRLDPEPVRYKVDVSCQQVDRPRAAVLAWLDDLLPMWGLPPAGVHRTVDSLDRAFGAAEVDYVSFSFGHDMRKATAYLRPGRGAALAA